MTLEEVVQMVLPNFFKSDFAKQEKTVKLPTEKWVACFLKY